jgi:hypothetical protein
MARNGRDAVHLENVVVDALAVMKILKHARENPHEPAQGPLLGASCPCPNALSLTHTHKLSLTLSLSYTHLCSPRFCLAQAWWRLAVWTLPTASRCHAWTQTMTTAQVGAPPTSITPSHPHTHTHTLRPRQ